MIANDHAVSLRVSLTERCQLRCRYCRPAHAVIPLPGAVAPWQIWHKRIKAVADAVSLKRVRFTGGEPTLYPELVSLVEACADDGLPELAITSNGFRLADKVWDLSRAGLSRANISLDSLDPQVFERMTGARPEKVIEAVDASLAAGLKVKLNAVILRGINDSELEPLVRFAAARSIPIRFLEMMPIGPAAMEFRDRYMSGQEMMTKLREESGFDFEALHYTQGATSRNFRVVLPDGGEGVCGFILPTSTPFCQGCRRLRISSDGCLMGCLAQPDTLDMDDAVNASEQGDFAPMRSLINTAFAVKSRQQRFEQQRAMIRVGG
jgi:cyclic pyranopterin phosphate synthase